MITSFVLQRAPARYNMVGQRLPDSLHDTDQVISPGLVRRLQRYALGRLQQDAGFRVRDWRCEVYTMDGDTPRSERFYCVEFTNERGGMLGVQGIAIGRGGHPCLDHGICVEEGRDAITGSAE
ncbi:hypothetical protein ABID37_000901 [Aquamicrobium terrae]|uniref:Uncharacterized protein n=1 Tax=Aquamicrobium terrae TaxID=1324945 RepID=A0ABV2MV93_9HYPH